MNVSRFPRRNERHIHGLHNRNWYSFFLTVAIGVLRIADSRHYSDSCRVCTTKCANGADSLSKRSPFTRFEIHCHPLRQEVDLPLCASVDDDLLYAAKVLLTTQFRQPSSPVERP